jgi:hypothetical protein
LFKRNGKFDTVAKNIVIVMTSCREEKVFSAPIVLDSFGAHSAFYGKGKSVTSSGIYVPGSEPEY